MSVPGAFGVLPESHAVASTLTEDEIELVHRTGHGQGRNNTSTAAEGASLSTEEEEQAVIRLARTLTHRSVKDDDGHYINPFYNAAADPILDPSSPKFSARAWTKTLVGIAGRDPERYPKRTAGVSYKNVSVYGFGNPTDYQKTFGNYPLEVVGLFNKMTGRGMTKIQILRDFDGLVRSGEMLVVLGRPGSGCSTLLKTISGETAGFFIDGNSEVNYQGISKETMHSDFRGECIYQAEADVHFPQLTVGQTLQFAAEARAPSNRFPGVTREQYATHMRDVIMAMFGLSHTVNTMVGNDFIRGVSGGERKRVSIAEAALGSSPIQCWDNSTRGLDSATALEFVRTLRLSTELSGSTAIVAIYQASQSIYDVFDKVSLLYEGRQIYFGNIHAAKTFFINLGFDCPKRQPTADFLTSLTSPLERIVRPGFEHSTPKTPDEFAAVWQKSEDRAQLLREIDEFNRRYPTDDGVHLAKFQDARRAQQAKRQRIKSPYTISVPMQIKLCIRRGFQRLNGDKTILISGIFGNGILAIIVGSVFYNLQNNTNALYGKGALLFFGILLSAFSSALEMFTLFGQRPIVEKHTKYAFYHPFAEAIASMICDLPNKIGTSLVFNLTLYFMANLRREPRAFFIFFLFSFVCVLTMSMIFRSTASASRSLSQAMAPSSIFTLALIIYTGFAIPVGDMHPWFRWVNYIDPVAYAFEALMINEFHGVKIPCSRFVPYENVPSNQRVCATTGAAAGADFVDGDVWLAVNFNYTYDHLWRNLGIMFALMAFGLCIYLFTTEYVSAKRSKGEVLLFPRSAVPKLSAKDDIESDSDGRITSEIVKIETAAGDAPPSIQRQTTIFQWEAVNYDIKIGGEARRLLDDVDGWVKPGTLTALMGVSGAGKTTLLDVLANRVTMGVVSGHMLVDGRHRDSGFQRKTGYVQQQDLHLATSTVREALTFSAILRQPATTPLKDKIAYVDEVIKVLEMENFANAVVGIPGEGLNVEQRKRLTIGVELAAKPVLLLFLDEPTSGLDSQTAWSICVLLRKLANSGQAILCTIHQPSAILFQEFDRLLFLTKGGKTVYFGEIGEKSNSLTDYFVHNGSRPCREDENPAEWMLEVIGAAPGSETTIDWPQVWRNSPEKKTIKRELVDMQEKLSSKPVDNDPTSLQEFAAPFHFQAVIVSQRIFQQYWRTPSYLYSKTLLCLGSGLFIGFSFWNTPTSLQGIQNQLFSIFVLLTVFSSLVQQMLPHFVTQRALYESRERRSKTYSWKVFMISNIIVEIPWNSLMAVILYVTWYFPIGIWRNSIPADQFTERTGLMFLLLWVFLLYASTFAIMVIAGVETAENGGNISVLMFSLCLIFCGILVSPTAMPGFWIFMYRISGLTYLVDAMLSVGLANTSIVCSPIELLHVDPSPGQTCAAYFAPFISAAGGYLTNPNATSNCEFCSVGDTNTVLASLSSSYDNRWRNFGVMWVYVAFDIVMAVFLYWLIRVPKRARKEDAIEKRPAAVEDAE